MTEKNLEMQTSWNNLFNKHRLRLTSKLSPSNVDFFKDLKFDYFWLTCEKDWQYACFIKGDKSFSFKVLIGNKNNLLTVEFIKENEQEKNEIIVGMTYSQSYYAPIGVIKDEEAELLKSFLEEVGNWVIENANSYDELKKQKEFEMFQTMFENKAVDKIEKKDGEIFITIDGFTFNGFYFYQQYKQKNSH